MSTFESAYKSLLQGVSQQLPQERLPGQLTAQVNMMSDPVSNLRRRPGLVARTELPWSDPDPEKLISWFTDIAGERVHIILNIANGYAAIYSENLSTLHATVWLGAAGTASKRSSIRATSVGNEFFVANIENVPVLNGASSSTPSKNKGYFYIASGSFGRTYTVNCAVGTGSIGASYTTPGGSGSGDAAVSTPEYIAGQLVAQLSVFGAPWGIHQDGPYVFVTVDGPLTVTSSNSTQYVMTSGNGVIRAVGDLPARLPSAADGYVARVGTGDSAAYYKYAAASREWLESGSEGSATSISNVPVSIKWNGTAWSVDGNPFEGRLAGDDTNNPYHEFMTQGITGMGTYQGRLVLMSGPRVSLSASNKPRRFFRTTVSNVLNSDPIEIGSSMTSSAAYEWAVSYQKDLVLFSSAYQAVMPFANQAITPNNAVVLPTSSHETDTTCSPVNIGRTLMFPNPRSNQYFGIMEMMPSQFTDSQYVAQDSTVHLPKYMPGRCRLAVSSSVASMVVFAPSGDMNSLIVHEYHWDGDQKVQQSWHKWTFPYQIASVHFAVAEIVVALVGNGRYLMCTLDPRGATSSEDGAVLPFLDVRTGVLSYSGNTINIPEFIRNFDPTIHTKLVATVAEGPAAKEVIGLTGRSPTTLTTVASYPTGSCILGVPFESHVIPSPPQVRDYKENVVHTGKATVLRFMLGTKNSPEYKVDIRDDRSDGDDLDVATLHWDSADLELGRGLYSEDSVSIIPCRTDMRTTEMTISSNSPGELNITSLEYVGKYQPKIKRR